MMIAQRSIEANARLRAKNQLTLPAPIANALGARPNDVLVFEINPTRPDVALVHLVRAGFAGAMTGVYGTTEDLKAFIREEHAAWGSRVISVPEDASERAERLQIADALNRVVTDVGTSTDPFVARAAARVLETSDWGPDVWYDGWHGKDDSLFDAQPEAGARVDSKGIRPKRS